MRFLPILFASCCMLVPGIGGGFMCAATSSNTQSDIKHHAIFSREIFFSLYPQQEISSEISNPSHSLANNVSTERARAVESSEYAALQTAGKLETATLGGGCFWCTEAIYQRVKGVHSVVSGYAGGKTAKPTYEQVCSGTTGHAECVQITFDPAVVSYDEILEIFWKTHDPTTLNKQGNDVGTQYRSVIFYHNAKQKELAEQYKKDLNSIKVFGKPIVTEIVQMTTFYPAEKYHQNYFNNNPNQGYCAFVVRPKIEKFETLFKDKIKQK